jgi:hypothetical protein
MERNLNQEANVDDNYQQMRENNPERFKDQTLGCTFQPDINESEKKLARSVDDLLKWGDEKRLKLATNRLARMEENLYPFKPKIDKKSNWMSSRRKGDVSDRLIQCGIEKKKKINRLKKEYEKGMFSPRINRKSRKLASNKPTSDHLVKKDNGKTNNLDFYHAVPKGASGLNLSHRSLLRKKSRTKTAYGKENIQQEDTEEPRRFDPVPNYLSPYNRELLSTDIPLKTILKRTGKLNNGIGRKKRTTRNPEAAKSTSRIKNANKSKSRSKSRLNAQSKRDLVINPQKERKSTRKDSVPLLRKSASNWRNKKESALKRRKRKFDQKEWNQEIRKKQREKSQKKMKSLIYKDAKRASGVSKPKKDVEEGPRKVENSPEKKLRKSQKKLEAMYQSENLEIPLKKEVAKELGNSYMYQSIKLTRKKSNRHGTTSPLGTQYGKLSLFTQVK